MILGAGLLLLVGVGLLVAGVLTGVTALYWGCVVACLLAAVLLVLVRRQMAAERAAAERVVPERRARETDDRPPPEEEPRREPEGAPPVDRGPVIREPIRDTVREPVREPAGEPPLEEVEVTDLLLVMDLRDEVLVVDEHPRYHLTGCPYVSGADTFPLPIDEARSDGFTPCGTCAPDRHLAQRARERKAGRTA